ncbi:MAG: hypothetical protein PUF72_11125 [Clostridiales bacterium]|nr:hypothetical protein [Clostridiales bacterium]
MKMNFEAPEIKIAHFKCNHVVTTSSVPAVEQALAQLQGKTPGSITVQEILKFGL